MRLAELIAALPDRLSARWIGNPAPDTHVRGVSYDSRKVAPGDLFVALRGTGTDGHRFIGDAVASGAAAVWVESFDVATSDVPTVVVSDSREALAHIAAPFFGHPARELALLGVTGTNGKTSTCTLVESILVRSGHATGLIGTVEIRYGDERFRSINTTPESLDLQRTLRSMRTAGVDVVAMEVSSHGLVLGRVTGCVFRVAAVSNVTQDHLDFHGDMETYVAAKLLLFSDYLAPDGCAVINADDPNEHRFASAARARGARVLRVSARGRDDADLRVERAEHSIERTLLRIATPSGPLETSLPLIGALNVDNALLAAGIATAYDVPNSAIETGLTQCPQVPGRLEHLSSASDATHIFVDYAHTPDALSKLLRTLRPLTAGRLMVVFGCGGDRDRGKRPLMAEAVAEHADVAIATSDNPRTEDPERILDDMASGLASLPDVSVAELRTAARGALRVVDRRTAIRRAIDAGGLGDTIVLAGKGHEDYQIIGNERLPFDDREEARKALLEERSRE